MRIIVTIDIDDVECEAGVEVRDEDELVDSEVRLTAETLHGLVSKVERYADGRLLAAGINANP